METRKNTEQQRFENMLCTLFSNSVNIIYKSTFYSIATAFYTICLAIKLIIPLIIIQKSDKLWIKEESFRQQPTIHFSYDLIIALETSNPSKYIFWSSLKTLNSFIETKSIRYPTIRNYEVDENGDGKYDLLKMFISIPVKKEEKVFGVKTVLLFEYALDNIAFKMDTIAVINQKSCLPASKLIAGGKLKFQQNKLLSLKHNGHSPFIIDEISTSLGEDSFFVWQTGRDDNEDTFDIDITVLYSEDTFMYKTGFWYLLKWAWS
ncbi:transmembrane protein 231-like protein [Leptotrombidium deliense]|uniref:Transmembrane protein 231 n=1 Tax=Leptotrombidium deliense TaxID=299467 RepID=A0A443SGH0_9ACAR|nr:transmembrane protein 231-like protein [Leptotrombidium deliense]